jgi:hypothetical protein
MVSAAPFKIGFTFSSIIIYLTKSRPLFLRRAALPQQQSVSQENKLLHGTTFDDTLSPYAPYLEAETALYLGKAPNQ